MLFNEKKAAQIAAFFLLRGGGRLDILKLMKLMYLAERSSFEKFGEPMIGDRLYSMEHGPVLSRTLNHVNGFVDSGPDGWESWVSDRENHLLALNRQIHDVKTELSSLSNAELEILEDLWNQHGHLTGFELRDLTHEICTEWEDPENSSIPIPYMRVLRHVGYSQDVARELIERMRSQRQMETMLKTVD
jgi:uncharacterized phage-associated protein